MPVFGAWFGWKLAQGRLGAESLGRALGLTLAALGAAPRAGYLAGKAGIPQQSLTTLWMYVAVRSSLSDRHPAPGPRSAGCCFAYGLAARIPVALVMLVAMLGNWGTHYDAPPSPGASPP